MKTIGEVITEIYASRTDDDFRHMREKIKLWPKDKPLPEGGYLAATLLSLKIMEESENM